MSSQSRSQEGIAATCKSLQKQLNFQLAATLRYAVLLLDRQHFWGGNLELFTFWHRINSSFQELGTTKQFSPQFLWKICRRIVHMCKSINAEQSACETNDHQGLSLSTHFLYLFQQSRGSKLENWSPQSVEKNIFQPWHRRNSDS